MNFSLSAREIIFGRQSTEILFFRCLICRKNLEFEKENVDEEVIEIVVDHLLSHFDLNNKKKQGPDTNFYFIWYKSQFIKFSTIS